MTIFFYLVAMIDMGSFFYTGNENYLILAVLMVVLGNMETLRND